MPSWLPESLLAGWWPRSARGLLIAVALPLGGWFAVAPSGETTPHAAWPDLVVDPNSAPIPVLEALPGLGPALASRIAAARQIRPFASLADFDRRVKGIGPAKSRVLAPYFRFPVP